MTKLFWSWRGAISKSDLEPTTRLVLHTLSMWMNDMGTKCYPTIDQLMEASGLSNRVVILHLNKAEEAGFITRKLHGFKGQKWRNYEYQATIPQGYEFGREADDAESQAPTEGYDAKSSRTCEGGYFSDEKVVTQSHTNYPLQLSNNNSLPPISPKSVSTKVAKAKFAPPDWIPKTDWDDFEDMRKSIRKPMTDAARRIMIRKLEELHRDGHDPGDVLQQSTANSWQSVFPLKGNSHANRNTDPSKLRGAQASEYLERLIDANLAQKGLPRAVGLIADSNLPF